MEEETCERSRTPRRLGAARRGVLAIGAGRVRQRRLGRGHATSATAYREQAAATAGVVRRQGDHARAGRRLGRQQLAAHHGRRGRRTRPRSARTSRSSSTPTARANTQKSISDIQGLVAQGVNAIVIYPDAGKAILPALTQATKAGVVTVPYWDKLGGTEGEDYTRHLYIDWGKSGEDWGQLARQGARRQGQLDLHRRHAGQRPEPRAPQGHGDASSRTTRTSSRSARCRTASPTGTRR